MANGILQTLMRAQQFDGRIEFFPCVLTFEREPATGQNDFSWPVGPRGRTG
jgi:hypothetical protein